MVSRRLEFIVEMLVAATLLLGCGSGASAKAKEQNHKLQFVLPTIPMTITATEQRVEYLTEHYWDRFNFADSLAVASDSLMNIAVGGYVQLLTQSSPAVAESSIKRSLARSFDVGYDPYERLTTLLEQSLYDPNSIMRNEEIFIHVLRSMVANPAVDDIYKIRPQRMLDMALKNRLGTVATDFGFTTRKGAQMSLHAIESPYTILYFNSPDCDDCTRVKGYIERSQLLTELVGTGKLKIVGVYTETDFDMWRKASYPSTIVNGADRDHAITRESLYDLRALPTIYLLDEEKRILLKDRSIEEVEAFLARN